MTSTASSDRTTGPLPVVIGVTGHRGLRAEDLPALENLVRVILTDTRDKYPHSPLLLLSPLAEGSDRLVARVGLAMGARLIALLPLPQALYEQDFATEESRKEFRTLMASAESSFELPPVDGSTQHELSQPGVERNRQYAQAGAFVARYSHIFLALWDGVGADGKDKLGGTGDTVEFRLKGAPGRYDSASSPLSFVSCGPVYHIVTPRPGAATPEKALTTRFLVPPRETAESFDERLRWIDEFNKDAIHFGAMAPAALAASQSQMLLIPEQELSQQIEGLAPSARSTLHRYAVADTLALHFGGRTRKASRQLFIWVFIAAFFFNLFHSLPSPHVPEDPTFAEELLGLPWLLLCFVLASLTAKFWVHGAFEEGDYQNKHQDYRALAEALRIQFFWQVAGVPEAVVDHYLRKQRGALEWIRNALRAWDAESRAHDGAHSFTRDERLRFVAKHWVWEQRNYYAGKARREQAMLERDERRIETLVRISIGLAIALALVLTLPVLLPLHALEAAREMLESHWVHGLVMVTIVTLGVAAGLLHGYNQQLARSEHAKQFGRMSELFDTAAQHLDTLLAAGDHRRAASLLRELGEEALEENGDWVLLHRERPLEVPHSG
jgi:hypothetical protein